MCKPAARFTPSRKGRGFTLIELLVVMVIAGILASYAMPAYTSFIAAQRIKTASFDLISTMTFARSEAIKRNGDVTLSFDPAANVFTVITDIPTPGIVLRRQALVSGINMQCKAGGALAPCPGGGVVYSASGRLASAFLPLELSDLTNTTAVHTRCITLDLSGLPKSKKGGC